MSDWGASITHHSMRRVDLAWPEAVPYKPLAAAVGQGHEAHLLAEPIDRDGRQYRTSGMLYPCVAQCGKKFQGAVTSEKLRDAGRFLKCLECQAYLAAWILRMDGCEFCEGKGYVTPAPTRMVKACPGCSR